MVPVKKKKNLSNKKQMYVLGRFTEAKEKYGRSRQVVSSES